METIYKASTHIAVEFTKPFDIVSLMRGENFIVGWDTEFSAMIVCLIEFYNQFGSLKYFSVNNDDPDNRFIRLEFHPDCKIQTLNEFTIFYVHELKGQNWQKFESSNVPGSYITTDVCIPSSVKQIPVLAWLKENNISIK